MKIYDCFIFNNELALLELRLNFLNDVVDHFVLVESSRTLSGTKKVLTFHENKSRFKDFLHKIIYLEAPLKQELEAWDYEFFQRNFIQQGLLHCDDDDIILISDVDEIINLKKILALKENDQLKLPSVIELPVCYYYLNLISEDIFRYNLIATYAYIKNQDIGKRNYIDKITNLVTLQQVNTGWHFSYLFGEDVSKYISKIESFSHQEYNTEYFKDPHRLLYCITNGLDIFDRDYNYYFQPKSFLRDIFPLIEKLKLENNFKRLNLADRIKTYTRNVHVRLYNLKKVIQKK